MNWILSNQASLAYFWPELLLIASSVFILLLGTAKKGLADLSPHLGYLTLAGFFTLALVRFEAVGSIFSGAAAGDEYTFFFRLFFALVAAITLGLIGRSEELKGYSRPELVAFVLTATVGMVMMASATDLLMLFLSLEMVSIVSYVLVGYRQRNRASSEAGLKYLLYGAVASGVMVFGLSFLFGLVGSTDFQDLARFFADGVRSGQTVMVLFSLFCVMVGFGFKMAIFPTHMWCPDVYEGAPIAITSFLSVGPKAAGFAMALRFFYSLFWPDGTPFLETVHWEVFLAIIAAVTMTVGNLGALNQTNIKRLMAYSSIAHAGYLLMGVAVWSLPGVEAVLFYLVVYLLMNFGAFLVVLIVANRCQTEELEGYRGLAFRSPWLGILMAIFLFSLTGIPPFAGFIGKFYLFSVVIQEGIYWLAIVAAINTAISLYYYARILRQMFLLDPETSDCVGLEIRQGWLLLSLALPTIGLGIYWEPLWVIISASAAALF